MLTLVLRYKVSINKTNFRATNMNTLIIFFVYIFLQISTKDEEDRKNPSYYYTIYMHVYVTYIYHTATSRKQIDLCDLKNIYIFLYIWEFGCCNNYKKLKSLITEPSVVWHNHKKHLEQHILTQCSSVWKEGVAVVFYLTQCCRSSSFSPQ